MGRWNLSDEQKIALTEIVLSIRPFDKENSASQSKPQWQRVADTFNGRYAGAQMTASGAMILCCQWLPKWKERGILKGRLLQVVAELEEELNRDGKRVKRIEKAKVKRESEKVALPKKVVFDEKLTSKRRKRTVESATNAAFHGMEETSPTSSSSSSDSFDYSHIRPRDRDMFLPKLEKIDRPLPAFMLFDQVDNAGSTKGTRRTSDYFGQGSVSDYSDDEFPRLSPAIYYGNDEDCTGSEPFTPAPTRSALYPQHPVEKTNIPVNQTTAAADDSLDSAYLSAQKKDLECRIKVLDTCSKLMDSIGELIDRSSRTEVG